MKRSSADSRLYNTLLNIAFVASALISAYLNLLMFTNLENSGEGFTISKLILGGMSITLEAMKIITLLRRNTYEALDNIVHDTDKKVDTHNIVKKKHFYFSVYLFFAAIAIFASIGFSLQTTYTTQQESTRDVSASERRLNRVKEQTTIVNELELKLSNREAEIANATRAVRDAQLAFESAGNKLDNFAEELAAKSETTFASRQAMMAWGRQQTEYYEFRRQINYDQLETDMRTTQQLLDDLQSNRLELQYKEASDQLAQMIVQYGEIWQIEEELQAAKDKQIHEQGSTGMFTLIADTFGIGKYVQQIKFIVLLVISILIELTIYMTSNDVSLDKNLLHKFRKDLPPDLDIPHLFTAIDKEQDLYSYNKDLKLTGAEKRILKQRVDDAVEKALEAQDKKNQAQINRLTKDYISQITGYKQDIKTLKAQLASKETDSLFTDNITEEDPITEAVNMSVLPQSEDAPEEIITAIIEEPLPEEKPAKKKKVSKKKKEPAQEELPVAVEDTTIESTPSKEILDNVPEQPIEAPVNTSAPEEEPAPVQEEIKVPVTKIEPVTTDSSKPEAVNLADLVSYRLGRTYPRIKDQFETFVNGLFDGIDTTKAPYALNDLVSTAGTAGLSEKTQKVFIKRLYEMTSNDKPLIYDKDGKVFTDFTKDYIINYATAVVA